MLFCSLNVYLIKQRNNIVLIWWLLNMALHVIGLLSPVNHTLPLINVWTVYLSIEYTIKRSILSGMMCMSTIKNKTSEIRQSYTLLKYIIYPRGLYLYINTIKTTLLIVVICLLYWRDIYCSLNPFNHKEVKGRSRICKR